MTTRRMQIIYSWALVLSVLMSGCAAISVAPVYVGGPRLDGHTGIPFLGRHTPRKSGLLERWPIRGNEREVRGFARGILWLLAGFELVGMGRSQRFARCFSSTQPGLWQAHLLKNICALRLALPRA